MLVMAGAQGRAARERGAHARTVRRAAAPAAARAGAESLVELGRRLRQPLPRTRPGAVARASITTRSRCCRTCPNTQLEERASRTGPPQPHQLRVPPAAGISAGEAHLGRAACRRALGAARRVLLGRVRTARVAADLLGRPRDPRRRSHQGRVRSRHSARRRRALLRPGLFPPASRRERLAARRLPRRGHRSCCRSSRRSTTARRSSSRSRRARARSSRASGKCRSAATRCCCSTRTSTATSPRIAS